MLRRPACSPRRLLRRTYTSLRRASEHAGTYRRRHGGNIGAAMPALCPHIQGNHQLMLIRKRGLASAITCVLFASALGATAGAAQAQEANAAAPAQSDAGAQKPSTNNATRLEQSP